MIDKINAKEFGRTVDIGEVYNIFANFKFTDLQAVFGIEQMKSFLF